MSCGRKSTSESLRDRMIFEFIKRWREGAVITLILIGRGKISLYHL